MSSDGDRPTHVALLRGINVGGRNRVPMAELRALCERLGWSGVQTYIQSGNVVFRAAGAPAELEARLEGALRDRLGVDVPVIVRAAAEWSAYADENPFPDVAYEEGKLLMLALSKAPPASAAAERLRERAGAGERVARVDGALWIHYAGGVGRSKLTPGAARPHGGLRSDHPEPPHRPQAGGAGGRGLSRRRADGPACLDAPGSVYQGRVELVCPSRPGGSGAARSTEA